VTANEPSEAAKQYVRRLIAREYAWAELDGEGWPGPIIEFSYHSLMEAFDAGREATESRARLEGAEIAREAAEIACATLGGWADYDTSEAAALAIRALDLPAIIAEQGRVETAATPAPSSPA